MAIPFDRKNAETASARSKVSLNEISSQLLPFLCNKNVSSGLWIFSTTLRNKDGMVENSLNDTMLYNLIVANNNIDFTLLVQR